MARRLITTPSLGEQLLRSKLQILNGSGRRHMSPALSIVTGFGSDQVAITPPQERAVVEPQVHVPKIFLPPARHPFVGRTVYLSSSHLAAVDRIIAVWSQTSPRRLTRSAVLRRAVELLHESLEPDSAKSTLENN